MTLRRTPLKRGTKGLAPVSPKRARLLAKWGRIKARRLAGQRDRKGYNWCEVCGRRAPHLELDHVLPAGKGGTWTADNAQLICAGPHSCHEEKHGRPWP